MDHRGFFIRAYLVAVAMGVMLPPAAFARSLDRGVPGLFGGELRTTIVFGRPPRDDEGQVLPLTKQFETLGAALASSIAQLPPPSASGSFAFRWDPAVDTYEPIEQSLGPLIGERARALGRGALTFGMSYTHIDFDTLEGDDLGSLSSQQQAISDDLYALLPPEDQLLAADDMLVTQLDASVRVENIFLAVNYGLTDSIDIGLSMSINEVDIRANARANITDPTLREIGSYFAIDQKGLILPGTDQSSECLYPFLCARDSYSDSAWGTGDVFLRLKWHFLTTDWVDLAGAGVVSIPTGNADDLLGFHDPTFEPILIASKQLGDFEPHLNFGYAVRSGDDTSQARWVAGSDWRATSWLTVAADFLGYHDDRRDDVNDDVLQAATGFKLNPFGKFVLGGNFQFPLNDDGLRADVIYTVQLQNTF